MFILFNILLRRFVKNEKWDNHHDYPTSLYCQIQNLCSRFIQPPKGIGISPTASRVVL